MFWVKQGGQIQPRIIPRRMIETIILLRPQKEWREGISKMTSLTS